MENIISYIFSILFVLATLIAGTILKVAPPKSANSYYGFRTKTTKKNDKVWSYSQNLCANCFLIYSAVSIPIYALLVLTLKDFFNENWYLRICLGLLFAVIGVITTIIIVEKKSIRFNNKNVEA